MRFPPLVRRVTALLVLVLGTAVSSLLPMADAYAERAAPDSYSHVEQAGSEGCPPIHDDVVCQLCRGLRHAPLASAPPQMLAGTRQTFVPRNPAVTGFTPLRLSGVRAPRAPPAA